MSFHYPLGGGGAGGVDSVSNSDGTLTITPTTGNVIASLNLGNANIWTAIETFNANAIATTPTNRVVLSNTAASVVGVPVQISPALEFTGTMFRTGDSSNNTGTFRMYEIPVSGASAANTHAGTLQWDSSKNGVYTTNIMNLGRTGLLSTANGFTATGGSINVSLGSITAFSNITATDGQMQAGRELLTGTNGGTTGTLFMYGSTSGVLNFRAPAVVTNYQATLPGAQGGVGSSFSNNGSGVLSFVSSFVDSSNVDSIDWSSHKLYDTAGVSSINYGTRMLEGNWNVPRILASADLTSQTAAIAATTLFTPTASGFYRISVYEQVTTAASVSSILGGATGTVITYQDGDGGINQSITVPFSDVGAGGIISTNAGNTTTSLLQGNIVIYAKLSVPIQYAIGYTSVGGTPMAYGAHIRIESI